MINETLLRWRMRRGVLELDHVLNTFLDHNYSKLSETDKSNIIKLLECQDPMLLDWLVYRNSKPADSSLKETVAMILRDLDERS